MDEDLPGVFGETTAVVSYAQAEPGDLSDRDIILPGLVELTRDLTGPLENAAQEPAEIQWAFAGQRGNPNRLSPQDVPDLSYANLDLALSGRIGDFVEGREGILHVVALDLYYPIVFTDWGQRGDGGFAYTRALAPLDLGEEAPGAILEAEMGDFSDDPAQPTDGGALADGVTRIEAGQTGAADADFLSFDVPLGFELSAIRLADYVAEEGDRAFLGLARGGAVAVDLAAPAPDGLLGGLVYGVTEIGSAILDDMGALAGAEGFEGALPAGTYTLWFNQTGAASTAALELEIRAEALGDGLSQAEAETVVLLYEAALDRNGRNDLGGVNFWIDEREAGLSETDLARAFLDSGEFEAAFGAPENLSDRALVEQLYRNVLGRGGEAPGIDFWTATVGQQSFDRAELVLAFALSPENRLGSPFTGAFEEIAPGDWAFV